MTNHLDKGISRIEYNFLNLPSRIIKRTGDDFVKYTYRADGVKVNKMSHNRITNYLDGFQYEMSYARHSQGIEMMSPHSVFFPTAEGYYDVKEKRYVYNYTDHLGNIRLSYSRSGIIETNHYYPFGLKHEGYDTFPKSIGGGYQYKYQGQELQSDTGWYSFKWRNYDPTFARFFNVDPLSEKYAYQSHYNFSENRVIDGVELEGLEFVSVHGTGAKRDDTTPYSMIVANYQGNSTWQRGFVEQVAKITGWATKSTYEYSWTGDNNVSARNVGGRELARWLMSETNPYREQKHATLMGHSHGGNVNKVAKNILEQNGWKVDIINIATPQREDFQSNEKGNGLYINFYNSTDVVQYLGKIGDWYDDTGAGKTESARIDSKAGINREVGFKNNWIEIYGGHSYHRDANAQKQMIDIINIEVKKK